MAPVVAQAQTVCNQANAPFYEITELKRSGFDDGTGHVTREGDNFDIRYQLRACVTIGDPNSGDTINVADYTPTARFTLSPTSYHTEGWNLGGYGISGAGNAEKASHSDLNENNRNWKAVRREQSRPPSSIRNTDEFTLTWTLLGTSTDNNCRGRHGDSPGYVNAASVHLELLDGGGAMQAERRFFINVTDDDTPAWKPACQSAP